MVWGKFNGTYEDSSAFGVRVIHESPLFLGELGGLRSQAVEKLPVLFRSFVVLMLYHHEKVPLDSITKLVHLFIWCVADSVLFLHQHTFVMVQRLYKSN